MRRLRLYPSEARLIFANLNSLGPKHCESDTSLGTGCALDCVLSGVLMSRSVETQPTRKEKKEARFVTSTHYSWLKPHTPAAASIHFRYPHTGFCFLTRTRRPLRSRGCATDWSGRKVWLLLYLSGYYPCVSESDHILVFRNIMENTSCTIRFIYRSREIPSVFNLSKKLNK